ncbi:Nbl1_Borealin_N domain-containing protein [Pseudozyma hubeiensis]|nr:Nbl1_Borealin_N domain-containing protein [Pseudozyma hubeiensis]
MPVRKATRSTRSTRTTKGSSKASSSDAVLDENIDATSEVVSLQGKSSTPTASAAPPKKVLGERGAPSNHVSGPAKSQPSEGKAASKKSSKSKKGKKATDVEVMDDSRATTPAPSSPSKKRLPDDQVQACLQNYDLEAQARLSRLRASLEMSIQSAVTRMRLSIERMPRAVRELQLGEFIDNFGADIHTFMNRAPVQHLKETQEEWDQIREERSPAKAKRSKKDDDAISKVDRNSKAARTGNTTASTSRTVASKKKAGTRSTKPSSRSTSAVSTSPPLSSAASSVSSKPAPSLSTFQPNLPKEALQTPKPRMARPGEIIQYLSINGSPISGVIGADGVFRTVTMA